MKLNAVLFDLDGTLLPMNNDEFTRGYFKLLAKKLAPYGYDPKQLISSIWAGVSAMVANDGSITNEAAFWNKFAEIYGTERAEADRPVLEEFYAVDFRDAHVFCGFNPAAAEIVRYLHSSGVRTVLATNPIFPAAATEARIGWAGLEPSDFELVTTYENTRHCKPNPDYYLEVLSRTGLEPGECIMAGNDATEDYAAVQAGISVFLLTDCLINKSGRDLSGIPHGGFPELRAYIDSLLY